MSHAKYTASREFIVARTDFMKRTANRIAVVYFIAMAIALTFPGITPFNTIRPMILGIPFVFAWYILWILGALSVFAFLDKVYRD